MMSDESNNNKQEAPIETDVENQQQPSSNDPTVAKAVGGASWWNKNRVWIVSAGLLVVVALAVGLSVGLTQDSNDHSSSSSSLNNNNNNNNNNNGGNNNNNKPTFTAASLQSFGREALIPYTSCDEFSANLELAAERLVNNSIDSTVQWEYHTNHTYYYNRQPSSGESFTTAAAPANDGAGSGSSSKGVNSYGTNNQVAGVDEADVVKSDGVHIFALYGNDIVVMDAANVTLLSRTTISPPNITEFYPDINLTALASDGSGSSSTPGISTSAKVASDASTGSSGMMPIFRPSNCYIYVNSLLLTGDRLVAIASQGCYTDQPVAQPILSDPRSTVVFVFDVSSVPTDGVSPLRLVKKFYTPGGYSDARSINSNAYIVGNSYIDVYTNLLNKADFYNGGFYLKNLTEAQYRAQAYRAAKAAIPSFVAQSIAELKNYTGTTTCDNLVRLTLFQTSENNTSPADIQLGFTANGVLNTLTQVTAFDISQVGDGDVIKSTSGIFLPTGGYNVYANAGRMIVAAQGWNQRRDGGWWDETYLVGFRLNGASVQADAVGQGPGYAIDSYSMDVTTVDDVEYLRLATTTTAQWGLIGGFWNQTSESSNQIYVFKLPSSDAQDRTMTVVGSIPNISVSETIQSVRFFGDQGFLSTFKYTDPFITLDLSVPTDPKIVGELNVTGFSSYLHPIKNGTQILAVGQNANATTGWTSGFQVSLFDVSNLASPRLLQSYNVDNANGWSYSEAQWDPHAFRYLDEVDLLLVPLLVNNNAMNNSFDGFVVYNVDAANGITQDFTIEHASNWMIRYGCWSSASFSARSLVFNGNAVTLKGHTVESHNLDTHRQVGSTLDLDTNINRTQCNPYVAF